MTSSSSDDSSEQQPEQTQNRHACPHTDAVGTRWGDPITPERQAELQSILDAWSAPDGGHGEQTGPFQDVQLTGAEVCWLAEQSGRAVPFLPIRPNLHLERAGLRGAHLEGADLSAAHLEGAFLMAAHVERANLYGIHLEGANLMGADLKGVDLVKAHLEGASLMGAHLKGANLHEAHLEEASLHGAHLEGADLSEAHLERTNLVEAHFEQANLFRAHLEKAAFIDAYLERTNLSEAWLMGADFGGAWLALADLERAHLEGANLSEAWLMGADLGGAQMEGANLRGARLAWANLRGAWLDNKTVLSEASLDNKTKLGDIQWSGVGSVNLTQINWTAVPRLGDEQGVGLRAKVSEHEAVVRAYRQVAAQLRAQGISEVADRFAHNAQVRQRWVYLRSLIEDWRRPWRLPGDLGRYLGSAALALLAGYGYRPGRTIFWYLVTIAGFAAMFLAATHGWVPFGLPAPSQLAPLPWYEALILSVSSFHGRGFFQPLESLGDPVAALAAIEAVVGLLIEVSFIATFTQRFFGAK